MANKNFDEIAKEQFEFLQSEFGFNINACEKKDWGYELIYLNDTTGVKITYEFQEAYIFITLYQLINGTLIENPRNIEQKTILYSYGLDDIINERDSLALIKPAYQYGEDSDYYDKKNGLILYVSAFAKNLKKYAADVLSGDFQIFNKIDKVVKERASRY